MNIDNMMQHFYPGLVLDPQMWKKGPIYDYVELAKGEYQFLENDEYNEKMFSLAKAESARVLKQLFGKSEAVVIVIDTGSQTENGKRHGFVRKIIKQRKSASFNGRKSEYHQGEGEQLIITTTSYHIRWGKLIDCLLNQDFIDREPRFKNTKDGGYPIVYLIHPKKGIIFYLCDDRGYAIYFPNQATKNAFER